MTMLAALVPPGVATVELRDDPPGELFPEEEALVARAVEKRRLEFRSGRLCARRALRALGHEAGPLGVGPRGAPRWPAGFVGSITHCAGYRAAACARSDDLASIGIDAEPNEPLPGDLLPAIALDDEAAALARLSADGKVAWDRLLFSAKEAVYKAWYPLTGEALHFADAAIELSSGCHNFRAELRRPGPAIGGRRLGTFAGRWAVADGLIVTAVSVPAPAPSISPPR